MRCAVSPGGDGPKEPPSTARHNRKRFTAAQIGCLGALALLLVLLAAFFTLPFVWRQHWGGVHFRAFHEDQHREWGQVVPHGLSSVPSTYRNRPTRVHVLRLGPLFWVVQVPR